MSRFLRFFIIQGGAMSKPPDGRHIRSREPRGINRASIKRLSGRITYEAFVTIARKFIETFANYCPDGVIIDVRTYSVIPTSTSFMLPREEMQRLEKARESNIQKRLTDLESLTLEDWSTAAFVKIIIHPKDKERSPQSAFASVSAKGLRPSLVRLYAQGCILEEGRTYHECEHVSFDPKALLPPSPKFVGLIPTTHYTITNGFEKNSYMGISASVAPTTFAALFARRSFSEMLFGKKRDASYRPLS